MSTFPKGVFIQQSDAGTEVFFLNLVGISSDTSSAEAEWHVERQYHIPKEHPLNFLGTVQSYVPKNTAVEFNSDLAWFVQHERSVEEE